MSGLYVNGGDRPFPRRVTVGRRPMPLSFQFNNVSDILMETLRSADWSDGD